MSDLDPHTHARSSDPDTSHAAAAQLDKQALLASLLDAFAHPRYRYSGATNAEITHALGLSAAHGVWKRTSDLSALGLIHDGGERRTAPSGREQIVWRITELGVDVQAGRRPWPKPYRKSSHPGPSQPHDQLAVDLVKAETELEQTRQRVRDVIDRHWPHHAGVQNRYAGTLVVDLLRAIGDEIEDGTLPL